MRGRWVDWSGSEQEPLVGFCERGDGIVASINGEEFLDRLTECLNKIEFIFDLTYVY